MSSVLSPNKRSRKHSHQEFLSLMIAAKRLPSSSYQQISDLNLSNLQLIQIDTFPFKYLPNLVSLDFSYNQLVSIEPDWARDQPNMIEKCNFSHNKLETFVFLKDFHHLKSLNLTENLLRTTNERFLILHLCPKLESLIDGNQDQFDDDQLKLDQWLQLMETKIDRLWAMSYYEKYEQEKSSIGKRILDEFRHAMMKIIEKQSNFAQIHLSPLANYLLDKKINELCSTTPTIRSTRRTLRTHLTSEFNQLLEPKIDFELLKYFRCHQSGEHDLVNVPVRMSRFEPNSSSPLLATCGGEKVCFIDCQLGEVTHVYEVPSLRSTNMPLVARKFKEKPSGNTNKESFSCLCWIELADLQEKHHVVAVGATNGHIYLLSAKWKIMFGQIELPNCSIHCLTWDSNDPSTLIVGSNQTVRFIDIQCYLDRLKTFIKKENSSSTKISIKQTFSFDHQVTNVLIYPWKNGKTNSIVLVGTTSGLFVVRDQTPVKLIFPKSMCTVGEHIESICPIDYQTNLIAMTVLSLDQVCCFDLEQTLTNNQLQVALNFASPARQLSCQMAVDSKNDENGISFECFLGTDHGSFLFHQIRIHGNVRKTKKIAFDHKRSEINWTPDKTSSSSSLLSVCLNGKYLCVTSNNNLICIYQRK